MTSVGKKLLTVGAGNNYGTIVLSPTNVYSNTCVFNPNVIENCTATIEIRWDYANLVSPVASKGVIAIGEEADQVFNLSNRVVFSMYQLTDGQVEQRTYVARATLENGANIYSTPFTLTFIGSAETATPIITTNASSYSTTCSYVSPSTTCSSTITIVYTIYNGTGTAGLTKISGTTFNIDSTSQTTNTGSFVVSASASSTVTATYRVFSTIGGTTYYSDPFTLTLEAYSESSPPVINVSGSGSGVCNYSPPSTSCTASVTKTFSVTNYTDGNVVAQRVSGSTLMTVTKTGSGASGSFIFSSNMPDGEISAVYRLAMSTSSYGTIYSSNFSVTLQSNSTGVPGDLDDSPVWLSYTNNFRSEQDSGYVGSTFSGPAVAFTSSGQISSTTGTYSYSAITGGASGSQVTSTIGYPTNYSPLLNSGNYYTLSFWIKKYAGSATIPGTIDNNVIRLSEQSLSGNYSYLGYQFNGGIVARGETSTGSIQTISLASDVSADSNWKFVVINVPCVPGLPSYVYVNNILINNISALSIGVGQELTYLATWQAFYSTTSYWISIALDNLAIWKRQLTPWEREYLYNSGVGRSWSNIIS